MEDDNLEIFGNDLYFLLKLLSENQVHIKEDVYIPLSQQEIADIAGFNRLKANRMINELIHNGFVEFFQGKRGKYAITKKGKYALNVIQKKNT